LPAAIVHLCLWKSFYRVCAFRHAFEPVQGVSIEDHEARPRRQQRHGLEWRTIEFGSARMSVANSADAVRQTRVRRHQERPRNARRQSIDCVQFDEP
jgi:hypothetical protein